MDAPVADAVRPVDPPAPATYVPVIRHGKPPHPTVAGRAGRFSSVAPAVFPDGVSLAVVRVSHGVEPAEGPGVFRGRPHTRFTLTLTNGSAHPIALGQVVVTTIYGSPARLAPGVYEDPAAVDFSGTVAPGGTATATYAFAIPPGQAKGAVTIVDFDDTHVAARFTGLDES